jgi:hypothetical protein
LWGDSTSLARIPFGLNFAAPQFTYELDKKKHGDEEWPDASELK